MRIGLSPLFISVHAADPRVRAAMLNNRRAPPIMEQLRFLAGRGIRLHTQIVVCPGYNDGSVLRGTIEALLSLGPALCSIAVVPVGLTKFRPRPLTPVDRRTAVEVCALVNKLAGRDRRRRGRRRVFLADEFFLKGGPSHPAGRVLRRVSAD